MRKLTDRQIEILEFIKEHIDDYGYPPTSVEIGENFGIYPNAAWEHVKALNKKGAVTYQPGKMRSLQVVEID